MPIDIDVPVAPIRVTGHGGATNLIYELHMTNLSPVALHLERIEVLNGAASLVTYEGAMLNGVLQPFGAADPLDKRVLEQGTRTVAFILVRINQAGTVPSMVRHKITLNGFSVESSLRVSDAKPMVLDRRFAEQIGWLPTARPIPRGIAARSCLWKARLISPSVLPSTG